jgi:hypothetical protein
MRHAPSVRTHTFEYDPDEHGSGCHLLDARNYRDATTEELKEAVGSWYLAAEHRDDQEVRDAYDAIVAINERRFQEVIEDVDVIFTTEDPYADYTAMRVDIERGVMKVFAGGSHPEHMTPSENVVGRAVHDYLGHYAINRGFDLYGEVAKWKHVRHRYPDTAQRLLFTEVVGQLCAAHVVGGFDSPDFQQKAIVAPDCVIEAVREHCHANDPERFNDEEQR